MLARLRIVSLPTGSLPEGTLADMDTPGGLAGARERVGNNDTGGS